MWSLFGAYAALEAPGEREPIVTRTVRATESTSLRAASRQIVQGKEAPVTR